MKKTEEILKAYEDYKLKAVNNELVEKFLNSPARYAFGMGLYTKELVKKLRIDYLTDSRAQKDDAPRYGIPVCALDDIPKDAVILCITIVSYDIISALLKEKGFHSIISFFDLISYNIYYCISIFRPLSIENFTENIDRYEDIYNGFSDDISKKTFKDVILCRLTQNLEILKDYNCKPDEQYFEDFLDLKEGEVFVDCGGFEGETTNAFIKKCPKYAYVYIFEPTYTMEDAKLLLAKHKNIEFIKKGVWNRAETLRFTVDADLPVASAITDDGDTTIEVVALDEAITLKATFIKMDVEGAELNALRGAEQIIKRDRPKLAICVYHRQDDFWQIFEYVKSIAPDYKVYLRHYAPATYDTVMFFV